MGSCEGIEIHGLLQTVQDSKQMVLQFKPSSKIPWEPCGFCDAKWDSESDLLPNGTEHSHTIKGIFSFVPSENQWTLTFIDTDKEEQHQNSGRKPTSDINDINDLAQQKKTQGPLQYEVDGKIYELRNSFPGRNKTSSESPKSNHFSQNKPKLRTKAIEFVIENQKYSTSAINTKTFEGTHVGEERSALEASLELLQVVGWYIV